jgi:carboxylesterase
VIRAIGLIAVAAFVVSGSVRRAALRRARAFLARERARPIGPDGVLTGAEGRELTGAGDRAIMIFHGFNDTPQSLEHLGRSLQRRGWTVSLPLLPHHGRGSDVLIRDGSAADWLAAARREWTAFRERFPRAALGGQSMGGAIAAILAARDAPSALVLLAPYLRMGFPARALSRVWPIWQLVIPEIRSNPNRAIHDAAAREMALGGARFTPRLVNELRRLTSQAWAPLQTLRAPTLVVHVANDYRIRSGTALEAYEAMGMTDKKLVWIDRGGHVVAADAGRELVAETVGAWLDERVPAGTLHSTS